MSDLREILSCSMRKFVSELGSKSEDNREYTSYLVCIWCVSGRIPVHDGGHSSTLRSNQYILSPSCLVRSKGMNENGEEEEERE